MRGTGPEAAFAAPAPFPDCAAAGTDARRVTDTIAIKARFMMNLFM
jgi:hypothetical protein